MLKRFIYRQSKKNDRERGLREKMFDWIRKKIKLEQMNSGLISAFTRIKEDLVMQRKFLEELYEHHHGFRKTTSLNHQRIADWIKHFDSTTRRLEQDLKVLEKRIDGEFGP